MHEIRRAEEVQVPENRQRRTFDEAKLAALKDSILSRGLLHAIVVRDDGRTLVAGERRLRALALIAAEGKGILYAGTRLEVGQIPVVKLGSLSPLEYEEAELEENVIRDDLTVVDKMRAIARLHELRTGQAQERNEAQTFKDTASEIKGAEAQGAEITAIRDALLVSSFSDDPEVQKAKTKREAINIVKRKIGDEFKAALAKNHETAVAVAKVSPHTILQGDCRELAKTLPDNTFDVICVDPPYGIDADKMSTMSGSQSGVEHQYEDSFEYAWTIWATILDEGLRICKDKAALYMFCDFRYFDQLRGMATDSGWIVWPTPLIWNKPSGGMLGDSRHGPRKCYETILFAYKGDKLTTRTGGDVLSYNPEGSDLHAARKPVELIKDLLSRSTVPGMQVIDFCAGSGTILEAATQLNLYATAIESSPTHFGTIRSRM